jgi:branched-chain amino acid transport system substrate-binding protein
MIGAALAFVAMMLANSIAFAEDASKEPIRIGVLVDQSANYDGAGLTLSVQMAVDALGGKVNGRPIEVISADHQNKPDVGIAIATKWLTEQNVQAIVGGANSAVGLAVQGITARYGRIYLNVQGISSDLSNSACTATATHWGIDTYALANAIGTYITEQGGKSWFFLTSDYTFGHALEHDTASAIEKAGGKVVGQAMHPFNNSDFAAQLLQAQASGSQVIGFANSGPDFTNALKQAHEFGLDQTKQQLVGLLILITNLEELPLEVSQGVRFASLVEWNSTPEIQAWSEKYMEKVPQHLPPVPGQMLAYAAVHHYLRAVQAVGATDAAPVMAKMRELKTDDVFTNGATIRADGRVIMPIRIMQVKTPAESKGPYDLAKQIGTLGADRAFRPLAESDCPLVKSK